METVECVVLLVMGEMHVVEQSGVSRFCCSQTRLEYSGRHRMEIHKSKFADKAYVNASNL